MFVLTAESQGPGVIDWLTLVVSVLAVVAGVWAATVGGRAERAWSEAQAATARAAEAERDAALWERDKVDHHYLNLLRSLDSFQSTIAETVVPVYVASPVGDTQAAWRALSASHAELLRAVSEALFVARERVLKLLPAILEIDAAVLVPIARDNGSPPIAIRRMDEEHKAVTKILATLPWAMRADLGLSGLQVADVASLEDKSDRSLLAGAGGVGDLVKIIQQYGIPQLGGGDGRDYVADEGVFDAFRAAHPGIAALEVGAIFTIDDRDFAFARSARVTGEAETALLTAVVRFLESGLREGPNKRDSAFGGLFAVWDRKGMPNP